MIRAFLKQGTQVRDFPRHSIFAVATVAVIKCALVIEEGSSAIGGYTVIIVTGKTLVTCRVVLETYESLFPGCEKDLRRSCKVGVAVQAAKTLRCMHLMIEDHHTLLTAAIT